MTRKTISPSIMLFLITIMSTRTYSYPIDCQQIGTTTLGNLVGCQIVHDPYPLKWEATIVLEQDYTWQGVDDLVWIYYNGILPVQDNCLTAATLPGSYPKGSNIFIQQICFSFNPRLQKGSLLSMQAFKSRPSPQDNPLIFNFKIPGFGIVQNEIEDRASQNNLVYIQE